ncbi:unnamed protein product [Ambrosiozyma monospora]|uniref:Unnamed protein product n=2 Tax=Ambrosiozyma monospora TaxID=43982 RepID=A0ACB5TX99_AMBMO|nr:unnamed protein product [Ambrosiozyma monospora]
MQNQMFSLFMLTASFATLVEQMLPHFVEQRALYEARERPSKTFSWLAFITAQITVEIPWMILVATVAFFCFYYPVGFVHNAHGSHDVHERGVLFWLFLIQFFIFTSTLGQACIAGIEMQQNAANIATFLFTFTLIFCGVLVTKEKLPGFWLFMYRVSPFTYWIAGTMTTAMGGAPVRCSKEETLMFEPYGGSCAEYLGPYMKIAGGYLKDPSSTTMCEYCKMKNTDDYLNSVNALRFSKWGNWGIFWVYCVANIFITIFLYWFARVPKKTDYLKIFNSKVETYLKRYITWRKARRAMWKERLSTRKTEVFDDSGFLSWRERKNDEKIYVKK